MFNKIFQIFFILTVIFFVTVAYMDIYSPNVVELREGMGNQMFQYAFGKGLEAKTGRKTVFDKSFYTTERGQYRPYRLDIFKKASVTSADKKDVFFAKRHNVFWNLASFESIFFEKIEHSSYFSGYFQNEKYFMDIKETIKKDFTFPELSEQDAHNNYWLKRIKSTESSVFIHVRNGDYPSIWRLSMDYYRKAVKYIKEHVENPHFFVFCSEWDQLIEEGFDIGVPYEVIGSVNRENGEDWKDMYLMSNFEHAIIANSTFSWWAAWLGVKGIVVAPDPWFPEHPVYAGTLCDNWVKISHE